MASRRVTPQHAASPNADRAPCYAARRRCGLSGGAGGRSVARAMRRAHSPKSFRFVQRSMRLHRSAAHRAAVAAAGCDARRERASRAVARVADARRIAVRSGTLAAGPGASTRSDVTNTSCRATRGSPSPSRLLPTCIRRAWSCRSACRLRSGTPWYRCSPKPGRARRQAPCLSSQRPGWTRPKRPPGPTRRRRAPSPPRPSMRRTTSSGPCGPSMRLSSMRRSRTSRPCKGRSCRGRARRRLREAADREAQAGGECRDNGDRFHFHS